MQAGEIQQLAYESKINKLKEGYEREKDDLQKIADKMSELDEKVADKTILGSEYKTQLDELQKGYESKKSAVIIGWIKNNMG